jgi:hypothetical protein
LAGRYRDEATYSILADEWATEGQVQLCDVPVRVRYWDGTPDVGVPSPGVRQPVAYWHAA